MNICDGDLHKDIEYFRTYLFKELKAEIKNKNFSESLKLDEVQLVLEPRLDDIGVMCGYYFVNPSARSLFWLDDWVTTDIFNGCKGIISPSHKGKVYTAGPAWLTK